MTTNTSTIDPRIQRSIDMWVATVPEDPTVENWRVAIAEMMDGFEIPSDAVITHGDADGVPYTAVEAPGASDDQVIIHLHSGGYVMGTADGYREFGYRLSKVTGSKVLIPDYRLAPENPFPAPVEDAETFYQWALKTYDPQQIVLMGDSAGGGLVIASLINAREKGLPMPKAAVVIDPLTDLAAEGASYDENEATDPCISRELAVGMGTVYIGDRDPKQTPLASPLYGDHNNFPPVLAHTGQHEVMRDDSTRLVESIRKSGGQAEIYLYDHVPHIFPIFPFLDEAGLVLNRIHDFLKSLQDSRVNS